MIVNADQKTVQNFIQMAKNFISEKKYSPLHHHHHIM